MLIWVGARYNIPIGRSRRIEMLHLKFYIETQQHLNLHTSQLGTFQFSWAEVNAWPAKRKVKSKMIILILPIRNLQGIHKNARNWAGRQRDVQKPVWIMKSSMAAPIEAPTAAILRYQPANCILWISPKEPLEAAVVGANWGAVRRGGEQRDDGGEEACQSQIVVIEEQSTCQMLSLQQHGNTQTTEGPRITHSSLLPCHGDHTLTWWQHCRRWGLLQLLASSWPHP
jgi:hypothetical protein